MNIAIVISVSDYLDSDNNLPGCKKDGDLIYNILNKTGKYDDILYIHESFSSAEVKEKFTEFIASYKGQNVEELFFYFTGHGEFNNEEFYYILSDYSGDKKKQTSLQNEEVDNLFKTLNPSLTIKVIDACQSGKSYIKESGALSKYFQKTINKYNNCYFFNSSLKDQSSFQSDVVSDFTLSFIKSIKEHNTKEIRYKDIIDHISDEFENNTSQTPFFVVQADYTEKFCTLNDTIKEYLNSVDLKSLNIVKDKEEGLSLIDKIKKQSLEYLTKDQAIELVLQIKIEIESFKLPKIFDEIFDLEIIFSDNYDSIIYRNTIGKWLDENPHDFFAKSTHKKVRKDRFTNKYASILGTNLLGNSNEEDYEWVRDGFESEIETPFKTIVISLNSKYPNIDSYTSRVIFFVSKRRIRFFYFITNFEDKNWDDRKLNSKIEWLSLEYPISQKDKVFEGCKRILNQLIERIQQDLDDEFSAQVESSVK
ncbi:MAG: caspase family protein [Flavobacterium sp.]